MTKNQICRLCLQIKRGFRDLISTKDDLDTKNIIKKLEEMFNLMDIDSVELPHVICIACESKLIQCHEFQSMVLDNQKKLYDERKSVSVEASTGQLTIKVDFDSVLDGSIKQELVTSNVVPENLIAQSFLKLEISREQEFDTENEQSSNKDDDYKAEKGTNLGEDAVLDGSIKQELVTFEIKNEKFLNEADDDEAKKGTNLAEVISKKAQFRDENKKLRKYYDFSCTKCKEKQTFRNINAYRYHMKIVHLIKDPVMTCCNKKLRTRHALLAHLFLHTEPDKLKCNQCEKQCLNKAGLKQHIIQNHAPETDRRYQCDKCPKRFTVSFQLKQHVFVHMNDVEKEQIKGKHVCSICGSGFLMKSILNRHYRQVHKEKKKMQMHKQTCICDICGKILQTKTTFLTHYQNQHMTNRDELKFQCSSCERCFPTRSSLAWHVRNWHKKTGPHICSFCQKSCPTPNALKAHKAYAHLEKRKFECLQCGKILKKALNLKEHMMIHVGSETGLYSCPFCTRTFNSSSSMYSHKKKEHPVEYEKNKQKSLYKKVND